MQDFQPYSPNSTTTTVIAMVFYGAVIIITFFGFSTIFVIIRSGRSRVVSFFTALIYLIFFLSLAAQGTGILNSIK